VAAFISTFIVGVSLHYKQLVSTDTPSAPPNGSPAFVINAHLTVDENLFKEKGRDIKLEKYEKQIFAVFAFAVRASLPNSPISAVGFHRLRQSEFPRSTLRPSRILIAAPLLPASSQGCNMPKGATAKILA
jgi:hypothetical protein